MLQVALGDQTVGEVLDFVVAAVELEGLAELIDEAVTDLQVIENGEDGAGFGVGIASCTVAGRTALEAGHM